jgi:hypothetical protein
MFMPCEGSVNMASEFFRIAVQSRNDPATGITSEPGKSQSLSDRVN